MSGATRSVVIVLCFVLAVGLAVRDVIAHANGYEPPALVEYAQKMCENNGGVEKIDWYPEHDRHIIRCMNGKIIKVHGETVKGIT